MRSRNSKSYSVNDDYYTPKWLFDALNLHFDLDVCAPAGGLEWIPAKTSFDINMDGLIQDWEGLVWCNPPYSNPSPFIHKFLEHANGIMLVQISKSKAMSELWNKADCILLLEPQIKFEHISGKKKGIFMPVALFGMGKTAVNAMQKSKLGRCR